MEFQCKALNDLRILIKENAASDILTGPAIQWMCDAVTGLYYTDDVREKNDIGLNKTDKRYVSNFIHKLAGGSEGVELETVVATMRVLGNYRNTQFTDYNALAVEIKKLMAAVTPKTSEVAPGTIVVDSSRTEYGKVYVKFHVDINPRSKFGAEIRQIQDRYFEENGIEKKLDSYGVYGYERFRYWSANKTEIGASTFWVHPFILSLILDEVFPDVPVEYVGGKHPFTRDSPIAPTKTAPVLNKVHFIKRVDSVYGPKIMVKLGDDVRVSIRTYKHFKDNGFTPKLISFDYVSKNHLLSTDKEDYKRVREVLVGNDFDVSEIDTVMETDGVDSTKDATSGGNNGLIFKDTGGPVMEIQYRRGNSADEKAFLKQCIQYTFPDYKWNKPTYAYVVNGDYNRYILFRNTLDRFNFDVVDLDDIIDNKISAGALDDSRIEGQLTEKQTDWLDNNMESEFNNSKFELYGIQKEGVKFLLSRNSAILGSETGAGKTVQMIYAAHLKTRTSKLPILIITPKTVQAQFVQEITDTMGDNVASQISTDPLVTRQWNVLYYDNFSSGGQLEERMAHLKRQTFGVIILDELHKLKHGASKRSANIAIIAKNTKTRWGASATVSSNKPLDVHDQLSMLGHPLGDLTVGKFKSDFSGMDGSSGVYVDGSAEDKIKAAENLNKWLTLTGVYIRQSKSDMKEERGEKMSNLDMGEKQVDIDQARLQRDITAKLAGYKDKNLAISMLIAFRESIAKSKVDQTVDLVMDVVNKNRDIPTNNYSASKVLVFTNFVESGEMLYRAFADRLRRIEPAWTAHSYLSSTPKAKIRGVKAIMEDKNSKVLVMSMKMGGTGISFPNTFSNMVINDYDWTPELAEQSEGRIFRINTTQDVNIKYVIASGADEELFENVKLKRELARIIQRSRKEFINDVGESKALATLVDAQKKLSTVEDKMQSIVSKMAGGVAAENFSQYFGMRRDMLVYEAI